MMSQSQRKLILVKHAQPEIVPAVPACEWHLSAQGQAQSLRLAQKLSLYQPISIFSSVEPKARETAETLAHHGGQRLTTIEGLHEHERRHVGFLSEIQVQESVKKFFDYPSQLVFGEETADETEARFAGAVNSMLTQCVNQNVVIVAHGTVITLFVAKFNEIDTFAFWKNLKLPSFVVLALPAFELLETVESV